MRLSQVIIQNFRSLKYIDVDISKDYATLIGKNDCGKSSFLRALEFLFDSEIRIRVEDICGFRDDETETFIQATISDCWYPEAQNNTLKVKRVFNPNGNDYLYREGPVPQLEILKAMSQGVCTRARLDADEELEGEVKEYARTAIREICEKGSVPTKDWIRLYERLRENGFVVFENGWHVFSDSELEKIVKVVFLPADVKGEEEIAAGGRSIFEKIGQFILGATAEAFPEIVEARATLLKEIEKISAKNEEGKWRVARLNEFDEALREEIGRFDSRVAAETVIDPPRLGDLSFTLGLTVSDDWVASLSQMGHGMRRSLVFAMLRANRRLLETDIQNANGDERALFLFLIEEPEIYLHPQAERRRMSQLKALAADPNAQVLLCTHSAIFVNLEDYKGIFRFERPERRESTISRWNAADLVAEDKKTLSLMHRFDPAKAAMLFADLVILVEGQCESDAIPFLADQLNLCNLETEVEVVDCHGNENIPVFQRILEAFGIRYVAWADSDVGAVVATIQGIRTAALGKIVLTDCDWENMNALPPGRKTYTSWRHFIFDGSPPNAALETRLRAAYTWNDFPI